MLVVVRALTLLLGLELMLVDFLVLGVMGVREPDLQRII